MNTRDTRVVDIDLLCAQTAWVRDLARHLVRDPAGADDIAQETLLAALQASPLDVPDVHRLRAWLRRVAINLSRLATRRSVRRVAREELVAQSDRQGSTADEVLRESVRSSLTEAIGTLEEPYRSTLEMRYFEGVSTSDIATRMGTTDNAVRKRLYRARNKLRESLDAVHQGDRHSWFSALLPLAGLPRPGTAALERARPLGHLARTEGARLVPLALGGLGVAAGVLLSVVPAGRQGPEPARVTRVATLERALEPTALSALGARAELAVTPAADPGGAPEAPPAPPAADEPSTPVRAAEPAPASAPRSLAVHGRVLDLSGAPVAALPLFADGADGGTVPLAWSGLDGSFTLALELAGEDATLRLRAEDERWRTVRSAALDAGTASEEALVIVSHPVRVAGHVVDAAGSPLEGVGISLVADESAFLAIDAVLFRTLSDEARATSDELGRFELASVPSGAGLVLEARIEGPDAWRCARSTRVSVPREDTHELEIRVADLRTPPLCLSGFVRFEDGSPAARTLVRLGEHATHTDEHGAFEFRVREVSPQARLFASRPGYRQVRFPDVGSLLARRPEGSGIELALGVSLVLVESGGGLAGSVVGSDGRPCTGWIVRAEPEQPDAALGERADEAQAALAATTLTDAEGRFELADLLDREHRLLAWDPRTLQATRSEPLRPGADGQRVLLRLAEGALVSALVGRVTDEEGAPLAGADVRVALALQGREEGAHAYAGGTATDALGFFELRDVPRDAELAVRVEGFEVHRSLAGCEAAFRGDAGALVVRIPRARALRVHGPLEADSFALLDAAGAVLTLRGLEREPVARGRLFRGTSILYAVAGESTPAEVVLYRGDEEIGRGSLDGPAQGLGPGR